MAAALITLSALILVGCRSNPASDGSVAPSGAGQTVAIVNRDSITTNQMYDSMQHFVPTQVPKNQEQLLSQPTGRTALQMLIQNCLLVQLASNQSVPVTPQEVDARYNDVAMVQEATSTQRFEKVLSLEGYTPQSFKEELITPEVARFNLETKSLSASDSELNAFYTSNKSIFTLPERAHIQRIVLGDEATAHAAFQAASHQSGFGVYAAQNLAPPEPGADGPGDMPLWVDLTRAPQGLEAVFDMIGAAKPGDALRPVQVQGGWWVVRVLEKQPTRVLSYSAIGHMVRWDCLSNKAHQENTEQRLQRDLHDMAQTAQISIMPVQYQDLAAEFKAPQPQLAPRPSPGPGAKP
jgi:parvulin-like peptidyl-prolyl isomerase